MVRTEGGRLAVYRDDDGALHAVSARCTHMGCLVDFNAAERAWECPCHGSRFDTEGNVVQGGDEAAGAAGHLRPAPGRRGPPPTG